MSRNKPIIIGSALLMGFYSLYHAIQRPILLREDLRPKTESNSLAQIKSTTSFRETCILVNNFNKKYSNSLQSHVGKPKEETDKQEFIGDFLQHFMLTSRCALCGSDEFVHYTQRRKNKKKSRSKRAKKDESSKEFLPRILQDRSAMSNHFTLFLNLLPNASKFTFSLHSLGLYPTCFITRNTIPQKSVSFSSNIECLLYDAKV